MGEAKNVLRVIEEKILNDYEEFINVSEQYNNDGESHKNANSSIRVSKFSRRI